MECPTDIFDKLWDVRGSGTDNERCVAFAYEAMGEIDFTGVFSLMFDEVRVEHLKDWGNLEDWIYDLGVGLSLEDVFPQHHEDLYSEEILPCDLVKDANELKELVLRAVRAKSDAGESGIVGIACTEITNENRTLWLLFDDSDAWTLGHGNYIEVVENLSELTESDGYYSL
tara:strand:+ start:573 stop:1085 length:513 start_codon:yes stop_codon:yes gene_type:complete